MAADFFDRSRAGDADPGIRITVNQARRCLKRHWGVIASVFACTVLGAYAAISLTTEQYEVRSALLVKLGRENLDAPPTARNTVLSTGLRREELGSEAQMLRSPDLLAQVVDDIGAEAFRVVRVPPPDLLGKLKFYAKAGLRWAKARYQDALIALDLKKRLGERDAAIALLLEQLSSEPQKDTDVVALSMRLADPQLAVRVQETLIERYLTHRVQVRQNGGAREFFEREVAELRDTLRAAEHRVNEWKHSEHLTVPGEQKALLLRQIQERAAARDQARSRAQMLVRQQSAAQALMTTLPERLAVSQVETRAAALDQVRARLTELETQRAHLLTSYKEGAAPVQALETEIAALRELMAGYSRPEVGSVTTQLNPLRQQLQQTINQDMVTQEGVTADIVAQGQQVTELQASLRRLEAADARLIELERDRVIAEQNYLGAVKRLTEAEVSSELDLSRISNVSVAMRPSASLQPVYPRKLLIMLVALPLGLMLGLGLAIALEWTSDTLHDAEDVEAALDLACLGTFGGKNPSPAGVA
jgi:uncharacterized protein involved in exopolysaccharide biosynthesis